MSKLASGTPSFRKRITSLIDSPSPLMARPLWSPGLMAVSPSASCPSGRELRKLTPAGNFPTDGHFSPTFSPDGRTLVTVTSLVYQDSAAICFWDVAEGKLRHKIEGCGGQMAFSPDGKSLACGDKMAIRMFDTTTFKELRRFERTDDNAWALAFSADGKRLISGHENLIAVWDVATGKRLSVAPGHETPICSLAFAPDSKSLASGAQGGRVCVWDLKTGRPRHEFVGPFAVVSSLAFSPDGLTLATGEGHGGFAWGVDKVDVRLWDLGRGELRRKFTAHLCGVRSLAFSSRRQDAGLGWR